MGVKIPASERNYFLWWHFYLFWPLRPIHEKPGQGLVTVGEQGWTAAGFLGRLLLQPSTSLLSPETAKMLPCIQTWPNTGKYWPLTSDLTLFCSFLKYGNVCMSSVGTINTWTPHIQCCDCLLSQAAHAGHSHLSVLCRTQHWDSTNLAVSLYFFFSSAFTHSVIELHWSGTKQILSIRHQPLVSALTAHNGLWDQALIERVISHDFLVIAFNDLILNPSRRQRQPRALSIRDGAQCLTDWDLIWPGFLKVVV